MQDHERLIMFIITGLTNFLCFPALFIVYYKRMLFAFMIGSFTFLCSLLYHSLESLEIPKLYLTISDWHRLDNIGSIMTLIYLAVFLMDNIDKSSQEYSSQHECVTDRALCYLALFLTMIMQTKHPWDLENTIVPVALFYMILVGKIIFYRAPRVNKVNLNKGLTVLGFGIICFYKGLDDNNDYLRIWHGMWHCCGSIALFFFYQSLMKDKSAGSTQTGLVPPVTNFGYIQTWGILIRKFLGLFKV